MRRLPPIRSLLLLTLVLSMAACSGHVGVVVTDDPPHPAGNEKAEVCHKGKTLEISEAAVNAHLRHGDHSGPCR